MKESPLLVTTAVKLTAIRFKSGRQIGVATMNPMRGVGAVRVAPRGLGLGMRGCEG